MERAAAGGGRQHYRVGDCDGYRRRSWGKPRPGIRRAEYHKCVEKSTQEVELEVQQMDGPGLINIILPPVSVQQPAPRRNDGVAKSVRPACTSVESVPHAGKN